MQTLIDLAEAACRPITALREAPFYGEIQGRDGLPCHVWENPAEAEFGNAVQRAATPHLAGLRGLLTAADLYVWQSTNLIHSDFEAETGVTGMRIALRAGEVQANDETVDQPDQFLWIFPDAAQAKELDMEDRRLIVEDSLRSNPRMKVIYPNGFKVVWYS